MVHCHSNDKLGLAEVLESLAQSVAIVYVETSFKESEWRELLGRVWSFVGVGTQIGSQLSGPVSRSTRRLCGNEDLESTRKLGSV